MKYTAYDGRKFDDLVSCEKYNSNLKEKYSVNNTDPIYLLSTEEYRHYKKDITLIPTGWWLRSPGDSSFTATIVHFDGSVNSKGDLVNYISFGARPALNLEHLKSKICKFNYIFPHCFTWAGATWRTLGEDKLAIAEMPIFYSKFDDNSNDYESSFIRNKLLTWYNFRVSNHSVVQGVIGD